MIKKLQRKLQRRLKRYEERIDKLKSKRTILSKHGFWSLGYYEGKAAALDDVLDEMCENKAKHRYSYSIDDFGTMTVFEDHKVLCTISDVSEETADDMLAEIVYEMRGVDIDKES